MAEILIVDDDDVIRDTVFELLSTDYKCDTAETAEQALAKLEAEQFEVVLTDISLPGLSGRELLSRVLMLYPGTPVIIVSGISDREHAEEL
ncbi:MAG TPA: response regulator, partial [Pyrinomonadaceae bacterium]